MGTSQPIREKESLELFMNYYKTEQPNPRNAALIDFGIYTALRISDILNLQWRDVYNFKTQQYLPHLFVQEKKTGKTNVIALNANLVKSLEFYRNNRQLSEEDFIFTKSTNYRQPLSRSQAFRIVKRAAEESLHAEHISCHSLRKTFGYHAWKQGTPPALLMDIYNHSSYKITKKYLGIEQDERDRVFMSLSL